MRVADLMTTELVTLGADATIGAAFQAVVEEEVRHVPIVDDGTVVGVVSDRDLRRVEGLVAQSIGAPSGADARANVMDAPITSLLSGEPITTSTDASIDDLIDQLIETRVGAVVVLDDDGALAGIVSYIDVLAAARGRLG